LIDPKNMGLEQLRELTNQLMAQLTTGHKGKHLGNKEGKYLVVDKEGTLCVFRITSMRFGCTSDLKDRCHILGYEELCLKGESPTIFSEVGEQTGSGEFWYHPHGRGKIKPLTGFIEKLMNGKIPHGKMKRWHLSTPDEDHAKYFGGEKCELCRKKK
jgi:hypothetical protein